MYKDLLVHLDASEQGARRFEAALALAEKLDARLNALYVVPPAPVSLYAAGMGPATVGMVEADLHATVARSLEEQCEETRETISGRAARSSIAFRWLQSEGPVAAVVGAYARCNDLVVAGQESTAAPEGEPSPSPGDIILEAGRPVLVVPVDGSCDLPGGHTLVAWNATTESARAVHDALPLLARSRKVTVQTFIDGDSEPEGPVEGFDIKQHLAHHGIDCRWRRERTDGDTGEALLQRAREGECTAIVLGAYGRSRLREYIFGGVTRHVFENATIPLFTSH